MRAKDLDLVEPAAGIAMELELAFPEVEFTSGRRSLREQARAMAVNCVLERDWIRKTYAPGVVMQALQAWAHAHYDAPSVDDVTLAFVGIMWQYGDADLAKLSRHLGGMAFDVRPCASEAMSLWLHGRAAQVGGKFLEREGGLVRWHFQC